MGVDRRGDVLGGGPHLEREDRFPASSDASGPTMWIPSTASVLRSATILVKPSVSPSARARPDAANGNFPTIGSKPFSRACASVYPTEEISGSVKITAGTARGSKHGLLPGDRLRRHDPLVRRLVREHGLAGHVADRPKPRNRGAPLRIDAEETLIVGFEPRLLDTKILGVGAAADGDEDLVAHDRLLFPIFRHHHTNEAVLDLVYPLALVSSRISTPCFTNFRRDDLHEVGVVAGQQRRRRLDDGHFRAEARVHAPSSRPM